MTNTKVRGNSNPQSVVVDGVTYVTRNAIMLRYGIGQSTFTMKASSLGITGRRIAPYRCKYYSVMEGEQIYRCIGYDSRPRTTIGEHMSVAQKHIRRVNERIREKVLPSVKKDDVALRNVVAKVSNLLADAERTIERGKVFWEGK